MKILVDATVFSRLNTGVARYEKELMKALLLLDQKNQYDFFDLRALKHGLRKPPSPIPGINLRTAGLMPREVYYRLLYRGLAPPIDLLLGRKADVALFSNYFRFPLLSTKRSIVFIYDLSFIHYAAYADKKIQRLLAKHVPIALAKATKLVTISEFVKQELVSQYGVKPTKIAVVYPGIDHSVFYPRSTMEVEQVRKIFRLTKPYILFTGTLEPRKNITALLKAYAALPSDIKSDYSLVLAGGKGWRDKMILDQLDKLTSLDIKPLGFVEDKFLPALYTGAQLFVFPSHYEGFGMPPLEAMACAVPVLAADNSSLPEVIGKAGLLVKTDNIEQIADAMSQILRNSEQQERLARQGLKQAQEFSWQTSAKKLLNLIKTV